MKRENISSSYFTKEAIEAAIAAAPDYVYDPDCPYDPDNEAEVEAYWSKGIVTFPGGHPHQDPLWKINGKRHPVEVPEKAEVEQSTLPAK